MAVTSAGAAALFLVILSYAHAEELRKMIFPGAVAEKYEAVCLDGSPAGYYINEHPASTGWVIYLQGGGLCVTSIDCRARMKGPEGSSAYWGPTKNDTTNVLAGPTEGNPFGAFSSVWVPYCSGDTWTGTTMRNRYLGGLPTTGHNIITALLDHLHNTTSFASATEILISGGSAGGIGVFHNADYISDRVRSLGIPAEVKASPQAGYFFPRGVCNFETFAAGSRAPFDFFAAGYVHLIEGGYMNPACAAAEEKKDRCWDVSVVAQYLKTPMFIAQNAVDQNQANDELLCPCTATSKLPVVKLWMEDYANKSKASMEEFVSLHPDAAVFMPACFDHTNDLCMNRGPSIVTNKYPGAGITYGEALGEWFFNGRHKGELIIESCPEGKGVVCNMACGGGCEDS